MLELLVVLILVAAVFAVGYFVTRDKELPATDTPVEVIEADLEQEAASAQPEVLEQVRPKRTRKPRAAPAAKPKGTRKTRTKKAE